MLGWVGLGGCMDGWLYGWVVSSLLVHVASCWLVAGLVGSPCFVGCLVAGWIG